MVSAAVQEETVGKGPTDTNTIKPLRLISNPLLVSWTSPTQIFSIIPLRASSISLYRLFTDAVIESRAYFKWNGSRAICIDQCTIFARESAEEEKGKGVCKM